MAKLQLCLNWEDVTLSVNAWKTVGSVKAGSDQVLSLVRMHLGVDGISGDAKPLEVRLQRVTASSGTGTSATPGRVNETNGTTIRSSCRINFTAEPTAIATGPDLFHNKFHPQGGVINELVLLEAEVAAAQECAVQVKVPTGGNADKCSGHLVYVE